MFHLLAFSISDFVAIDTYQSLDIVTDNVIGNRNGHYVYTDLPHP